MSQLPGFVDAFRPDHVRQLHRSIYNLKRAPQVWFYCLSQALMINGFVGSKTD